MKKGIIKRFVMLVIAAGCVVLLVLSMAGVFDPDHSEAPTDSPEPSDEETGMLTIGRPSSEGPGWRFRADRAVTADFEEMTFYNPSIIYDLESGDENLGPKIIEAVSEFGYSDGLDSPRIVMKGNVIIEMDRKTVDGEPVESGILLTEEMNWDRSQIRGSAPGAVEMDYTDGDTRFSMSGEELELDMRVNNLRLERDVLINIAGNAGFMESGEADDDLPTIVTCDGPFIAEEMTGKAVFEKNIHVEYGEQSLIADMLTVWRATGDEEAIVGEWRAAGNVRLSATGMLVTGKEIARGADGTMRLAGNSNGSVKMEGLEIESPTIIMHMQQGQIIAPEKGRLVMDALEEDGEPIIAVWGGNMEFDQQAGKAYFTREVHVTGMDMDIKSDALTLWVDPETQEPLRMFAEGNVEMVMPQGTARGNTVMMNLKEQTLELKGRPEATLEMDETRIEGREIIAGMDTEEVSVNGRGRLIVAPAEAEKETIDASWVGGMDFDRNSGKAELRRGVRLITEDSNVKCEELELWMTEDRNDVDRILARRNVEITTPEGTGAASRVAYSMAQKRIEMFGDEEDATFEHAGNIIVAKNITMDGESGELTSNEPGILRRGDEGSGDGMFERAEITWARSMFFDTNAGKGRFVGDVQMTDAERELFSDSLDLKISDGEERGLESITAVGGVRLDWEGRIGFGDQFVWKAPDGSGSLKGKSNDPARVAFEQGWFIGDEILFKDNFDEVTVRGSRPVRAGIRSR